MTRCPCLVGARLGCVSWGQVRAVEEVRRSMQVLVDEAGRERQEALELYSQESRKRKLIHNKLLELQGEGGSRQHRPDQCLKAWLGSHAGWLVGVAQATSACCAACVRCCRWRCRRVRTPW